MKLRRHPIPLSLLVTCLISISSARSTESVDAVERAAELDDVSPGRIDDTVDLLATATDLYASSATIVAKDGSKDTKVSSNVNPVDGKDGRPHTGPFVETAAQRDRKKAQGTEDEDEKPSTGKKPGPGDAADSDGPGPMPKSNDGVMDDPARVGPKEGTRGTEGGISEKSRQRQGSLGSEAPEKTPEEPKEVPPLPHSEQKELTGETADTKSTKVTGEDVDGKEVDDESKDEDSSDLAGLTVSRMPHETVKRLRH